MSRTSDTRHRTREAAADLVAQGRHPHQVTVDLIYAEIQQGSRTTINDELKQWKEEKAQADALGAELPPVVADSMRLLWVLAVEHGERVFEQRQAKLDAQLEAVGEQLEAAKTAYEQTDAANVLLKQQISTLALQLMELRQQLTAETAAKNEAASQAQALQQELNAVRLESARQLEVIRQEQEKQASEFQQAIVARDATFRAQLDTATQRLESAQAHMLQQIDDARQGQRRAESQTAKTQQQHEQLQSDVTELRMQVSLQARELQDRNAALAAATERTARSAAEKQTLVTDLASARGRLEGIESALRSLETRAVAAETRLAEAALRDSRMQVRRKAAERHG
jgi:chromosome segregation ATPase